MLENLESRVLSAYYSLNSNETGIPVLPSEPYATEKYFGLETQQLAAIFIAGVAGAVAIRCLYKRHKRNKIRKLRAQQYAQRGYSTGKGCMKYR